MINLQEIIEKANKINESAKRLLNKQNLPTNLDLAFQCHNQIEIFKLLNQLKKECRNKNLKVIMFTFVTHHTKSDDIDKVYKILRKATDKLFHSIQWKKFVELVGVTDFIEKLEMDICDATGWHPHIHLLLICENALVENAIAKYEKKFASQYLKLCISEGMSATSKIKEFMLTSGVKITNDLQYLGYIADYKKMFKPRIANLNERYYSPYQLPIYKGYDKEYKEFAKFIKNKKIFKFSSPSILGVPFNWREIDKTKHMPPVTIPDLNNLQTTGYYVIKPNKYWHVVFQFLPDKMLKHYNLYEKWNMRIDLKKFKVWLCFIANIDWFNFYRYIKENVDSDIFSTKRKSSEIPKLVEKLFNAYEEFFSNICTLDYKDPFLYLPVQKLIKEYEGKEEMKEIKFKWCNGKLSFE